jgi:hypothetical protein
VATLGGSAEQTVVAVLLGNGDGTFQAPRQTNIIGEYPTAIVAGVSTPTESWTSR